MDYNSAYWVTIGTLVAIGVLFVLKWAFIVFCVATIVKWIVRLTRNTWNEGGIPSSGGSSDPPPPTSDAAESFPVAASAKGTPSFCSRCGTHLSAEAAFCHKCGTGIAPAWKSRIRSVWIWCIALMPMVGCLLSDCMDSNADAFWLLIDCSLPMAFFMVMDRGRLLAQGINIPVGTVWLSAFLFWPLYPFKRFRRVYDVTRGGLASLLVFFNFYLCYVACLIMYLRGIVEV